MPTVTSDPSNVAQRARELEEFERLVERDGADRLVCWQLGEARLLFVACRAYLYHGTVATDLDRHGLARLRVLAQLALAHTVLVALVHHLLDLGFQLGIERAHVLAPLVLALGDLVKLLFYARCEIVIHDVGEVLQEKLRHHCAHVRGNQFALVGLPPFPSSGSETISSSLSVSMR